jgi:hypothetical protein
MCYGYFAGWSGTLTDIMLNLSWQCTDWLRCQAVKTKDLSQHYFIYRLLQMVKGMCVLQRHGIPQHAVPYKP